MKFQDFEIIETLAETHGNTTKIYLCRHQEELKVLKVILKKTIVEDGKAIEHLKNEKQALKHFTEQKNESICQLLGTFQDEENIYLILEMVHGLPIHKLLQMTGALSYRYSKILLTQIAQIMRQFHEEGYIYRDIKSSNFMVDQKGMVKLIDLGKAKLIKKERAYTICGTTHAMPPEVYKKNGYSYEFDYYSFGILVYEFLVGKPPFGYASSNKKIIEDIEEGISEEALEKLKESDVKDLISKLLILQPTLRLGNKGGFAEILEHQFFQQEKQFAFEILEGREKMSPYEKDFSEFISEVEDFGLDEERFEKIAEDDPFFKFL